MYPFWSQSVTCGKYSGWYPRKLTCIKWMLNAREDATLRCGFVWWYHASLVTTTATVAPTVWDGDSGVLAAAAAEPEAADTLQCLIDQQWRKKEN